MNPIIYLELKSKIWNKFLAKVFVNSTYVASARSSPRKIHVARTLYRSVRTVPKRIHMVFTLNSFRGVHLQLPA